MGVIAHNCAQLIVVQWNPLYLIVFPEELYGWVFGSLHLISQLFAIINIPMLAYCTGLVINF
jgi:hypothetical protein